MPITVSGTFTAAPISSTMRSMKASTRVSSRTMGMGSASGGLGGRRQGTAAQRPFPEAFLRLRLGPEGDRRRVEARDALQLRDALGDLVAGQRLHPLGAERLDVER